MKWEAIDTFWNHIEVDIIISLDSVVLGKVFSGEWLGTEIAE